MKGTILFITGIFLGAIFTMIAFFYFNTGKYATLQLDYHLDNGGILRKGTKIKYNSHFSEGFDQYILYLNVAAWEKLKLSPTSQPNRVIPYWISANNPLKVERDTL